MICLDFPDSGCKDSHTASATQFAISFRYTKDQESLQSVVVRADADMIEVDLQICDELEVMSYSELLRRRRALSSLTHQLGIVLP